MFERVKRIIIAITVFAVGVAALLAALVSVALIPKSAIRENVIRSAEYLREDELFPCVIEGQEYSRLDRYADAILLGIAWQYDDKDPLRSVMLSSYYDDQEHNEAEDLYDAATGGISANKQYLRYWHGSILLVRPLLTIFSIKGIYIFNGVCLALLTILLLISLFRTGGRLPALGLIGGLALTFSVFVPLSLEYTWMFLLTMIFALVVVEKERRGHGVSGTCFMVFGMLASYFDFLTTETLTLTVPLLLMLWAEGKRKEKTDAAGAALRMIAWVAGYALCWIMKWLIAGLTLGENVMPYVSGSIVERTTGGNMLYLGMEVSPVTAVINNIKCLFPFCFGTAGIIAGLVICAALLYIAFVYRGKGYDGKRVAVYAVTALIPFIRYMALTEHACVHYFFTFRALTGTVLAVFLIMGELRAMETIKNSNGGKK